MSRRDALARALAGYDERFEARLVDVITSAIADASMIDGVMVIRTGEAASALTSVLATVLALSPPATRSRAAIRKTADGFRHKLQARVRQAERDPLFADFKNRCFRDDDHERGGRS